MESPLKFSKIFAKRYPRLYEVIGKPSSCPRIFGNNVLTFSVTPIICFWMVFLSPKIFVRCNYSKLRTCLLIYLSILWLLYPCLFSRGRRLLNGDDNKTVCEIFYRNFLEFIVVEDKISLYYLLKNTFNQLKLPPYDFKHFLYYKFPRPSTFGRKYLHSANFYIQ